MAAEFVYEIEVLPSHLDANGHANNVEFVRWMQEAAVAHADATGGTAATREAGGTWMARSHKIEYKRAAMLGDRVRIRTWIHDYRRVFSLRRYQFVRQGDEAILAEGETEWIFVDLQSGKPRSIPDRVRERFELHRPEGEADA